LVSAGNPKYPNLKGTGAVVYFFDNCVETSNGSTIEALGTTLGQFLNMIRYDNGMLVPQVDLVGHSMGGLIVRSYLSGILANGVIAPPVYPRVRKFIQIGTPNFGSFLAANSSFITQFGAQSAELIPGNAFLWRLATWNQRGDDLRGVDAIAIVGNAGWELNGLATKFPNLSDGVVSTTSASLGFVPSTYAKDPSRTRVLPYCHIDSTSLAGLFIYCSGSGIANVDHAPETGAIVLSFLESTPDWASIGPPAQTANGGAYFALENAAGTQYTELSTVSPLGFGQVLGSNLLSGEVDAFFYSEFISGTGSFQAVSITNQMTTCGPFSVAGGYFSLFLCKFPPVISSIGPLLPGAAKVVQSGTTITINGAGFGAQQCALCGVTASNPQPMTLQVSSWSDTSIQAFLPSTYESIARIGVTTAAGADAINIMAAHPTKFGVFRSSAAFLEDSNGSGAYDAGIDRFIASFTGPGGFKTGDYPVVGDWVGDGRARVGIYRQTTGEWFLDLNNNGVFDSGDVPVALPGSSATYRFGGVTGDLPVVGDWFGTGKSCIGVFRSGFFWVLDLNCNGAFDGTDAGQDAAFPFGGVSGDVPVVGAWTGAQTRVGVVRKYAPAGVPIGNPFFWVLDAGDPNSGGLPANHQPDYPRCFAFGGLAGDVFIAGDWYGSGISSGAVYRSGLWVLDPAIPGAPQPDHLLTPLTFNYGGASTDVPVAGRW
jgi:hypothetical protein